MNSSNSFGKLMGSIPAGFSVFVAIGKEGVGEIEAKGGADHPHASASFGDDRPLLPLPPSNYIT